VTPNHKSGGKGRKGGQIKATPPTPRVVIKKARRLKKKGVDWNADHVPGGKREYWETS